MPSRHPLIRPLHDRRWLVAGAIVAAASGATIADDQRPGVEPLPAHQLAPVFVPDVDVAALRPAHPPIHLIPPMPMPDPAIDDGLFNAAGPTGLTFYDAETGETRALPSRFGAGLNGGAAGGGGFTGADDDVDRAEEIIDGFGDMYTVGPATTFPRRANVKLVMRFIDQNGITRFFVCSGSMNDAGVVLTAGHCVYARNPNGINIFDWAEEVWVYPGWDGIDNDGGGPENDEVINHWGWARGTSYLAGSDWVNNGNWDRDCGLIRIRSDSRNVGMLTGWFGWQWGESCNWIKNRTYNNYSFPAENCPLNGLHNGRDMYFWSGSIDSCPGNQMQLDTGGGCFDTVWGGMSGSGMYWKDGGDNRYVHAVCSTSNRDDVGRYCKLWEQFVSDMQDFENARRGNVLDLEALMFRVSGSNTVTAGQELGDAHVWVANATNFNPPADLYRLRVRLSSNNDISSSDTLIATWDYNVNFGTMHAVQFTVPTPNIPLNTPSGDYWLGVRLDPGIDGNSSNNETDTWDADPITVNGVADLVAYQINAQNGVYNRGAQMPVQFTVRNQGGDPSNQVKVEIRASLNTNITGNDPLLGTFFYSGIPGNQQIGRVENVTIPNWMSPDDYYIGMIVSASDDVDASNNKTLDSTTVEIRCGVQPCEPLWFDSFDRYDPARPLWMQSEWHGWDSGRETSGFELTDRNVCSPRFAIAIDGGDDAVQKFDNHSRGRWVFRTKVLVPTAMSDRQMLGLLNTYPTAGDQHWSLRLDIDGANNLLVDRDGGRRLPLVRGVCREIKVEIDLDNDVQTVWYAGEHLVTKSWSEGTGRRGGARRIAAVHMRGLGSRTEVSYDDMDLTDVTPEGSCVEDLDGDGTVGFGDLLQLLAVWGPCAGCPEDFDGNDNVGFEDLLQLLSAWGVCP